MTQTHSEAVVRFSGVDFGYDDVHLILRNVELQIEAGEFISVIGPNGGGKTTLLKLMLGLLRPSRGSVRLFGAEPRISRNRVGYVPQHLLFDPRLPITAMEVAIMGRLRRGFYSRADRLVAHQALERVGLDDHWKTPFFELSNGQRQRVLIARAIATQPDLLLLDEPTASADAAAELRLGDLIRRLNQQMTVVLITHDLGFVADPVRRVVCVNREVDIHPTQQIDGRTIMELYGEMSRVVRHDMKHGTISDSASTP